MPVRFDDSRSPLLVIHFDAPVRDAEVQEQDSLVYVAFARLDRERRHGVLLVNNAPDATISASQRRLIIDGNLRHRELMQRACVGIGIVIHSPVQRGILTALGWLIPSPSMTAFGSLVEAERWARERLA